MAENPLNRSIDELKQTASLLRLNSIKAIHDAASGHPGGSCSATDIVTALYFRIMRHDPKRPDWPERDRFIISKGHGVPVVYAAMAEAGYFPEEELWSLRKIDTRLQGHPSVKDLPGIEASTGSLGQGLSVGVGLALSFKIDSVDSRVFVLLGDGEVQEGQVWEAAMFARQHKLSKLTAILDYNRLQLDGPTAEIIDLEPVLDKWRAFGWRAVEIDGHDISEIVEALDDAGNHDESPTMIIARTVKGKGVSFMENNNDFHGMAPTDDELALAIEELS